MAHRITAPAMQRARRLLDQRVAPFVHTGHHAFDVEATAETFDPVPYAEALSAPREPFSIGTRWGLPWHSRWFRLTTTVPAHLAGVPLRALVDIGFRGRGDGFETEGLAWMDGRIVHAIQPDRRTVDLGTRNEGDTVEMWVEAAATPIIAGHEFGYGPTPMGDPSTAPQAPLYVLRTAALVQCNADVEALATELHAVIDLTVDTPGDSPRRPRLFAALDAAARALDTNDPVGSAGAARAALLPALSGTGSAHRIVATGHAHLDTAWLWPLRETRRKAVRTFANAVHLLERNPDFVYCHSQAQHYAWVEQDAPDIFARVKRFVAEGRWEPVGGMWVETDLNLPDGESLLRQMTQGQRAFRDWFGVTCNGAFLPDDFGYPAGLPQIVTHAGAEWFFTQKLSWNETNRFPHHSFWWEGLDGSAVFTHFSPVDTYNAINTPSQFRLAERNFSDHVGASSSLVLFGHGDGGGGPTQQMIERARLAGGIDSVPEVRMGRVDTFFAGAIAEYGADAPVWNGEMYFEKHRGTYSTQVRTKQGNRRCERMLREAETWAAANGTRPDRIDGWWQRVLTQQFHDIIPGSSIAWVHRDAETEFAAVAAEAEAEIASMLRPTGGGTFLVNHLPQQWSGVVEVDGRALWAEIEPFSAVDTAGLPVTNFPNATEQTGDVLRVHTQFADVTFSGAGDIVSMVVAGREVMPADDLAGFVMRADTPAEYDNWDIDMADADRVPERVPAVTAPVVTECGPLRTVVECRHATAASSWTVRYLLLPDRIDVQVDADWHEEERRLQWRFPVDVHAREAVCGTQFGHVRRPRHTNTTWDLARFEVCAHRWVAVHEPRFGVAVVADGPRGWDVRGNSLQLTVLRSPKFPDPLADRGTQHLSWSVTGITGDPAAGNLEFRAEQILNPPRVVRGTPSLPPAPLRIVEQGSVMISAVKPADDGSGDLVVRAWESAGGRSRLALEVPHATRASYCDALEDPTGNVPARDAGTGTWELDLAPFEIVTVRFSR
ncbi:MAG: alpha-mannosidase [Ilumatobacteraceae bacterium]